MNYNMYKLFSNCIIVKGKKRATICDLQRNKYVLIPLSLCDLFDSNNIINFKLIKETIGRKDINTLNTLNSYIDLLLDNELIFSCSESEILNFPNLDLRFKYPSSISNFIIDNNNNDHDFEKILNQFLIPSNCRHIQIRFFDIIDFNKLSEIQKVFSDSFIKSIEYLLPYSKKIDFEKISNWVLQNKKIKSLIIYNSHKNQIIQKENFGFGIIIALKQSIKDRTYCGVIHNNYFNIMIESFTESQQHNTCLNRKMAIDKDGYIRNCPSMPQHFGNIKDTTLEEVLNNPDFKKYWNVTKDMIAVCKDCEFRHICTDCRAYTERTHFENDIDLSKPLKCGYNPYTNEWAEWSTNPLKQKAIEYYDMQELVKKE